MCTNPSPGRDFRLAADLLDATAERLVESYGHRGPRRCVLHHLADEINEERSLDGAIEVTPIEWHTVERVPVGALCISALNKAIENDARFFGFIGDPVSRVWRFNDGTGDKRKVIRAARRAARLLRAGKVSA